MTDLASDIYKCIKDFNEHKSVDVYLKNNLRNFSTINWRVTFDDDTFENKTGSYEEYYYSYQEDLEYLRNGNKYYNDKIIKNVSELIIIPWDKLIKSNTSKTYYSSYFNQTIDDLKEKDFIWVSEQFDQAFIHLFDESSRKRLESLSVSVQPVIYKFNFKKEFYLINSSDYKNLNILNYIIPVELRRSLIGLLNAKVSDFSTFEFSIQFNKYILIILKELNKFLSDDIKIYGYQNYYDQNEIGLINFCELVNDLSIKQSKYKKLIAENNFELGTGKYNEIVFPVDKEVITEYLFTNYDSNKLASIKTKEEIHKSRDMIRMVAYDRNIKIIYTNFDTGSDEEWSPPEIKEFYKLKYLKYKQKYLQLKKKLNL